MNFLLFFYESIILSHATQSELIHEIDLVRLIQVFVLQPVNMSVIICYCPSTIP